MEMNTLLDGPLEFSNGDMQWFKQGRYHREDGPAFETVEGYKAWWLNGQYVFDNRWILSLKGNYVVLERGIPTNKMFGKFKLTSAKLLTAEGIVVSYDNLPGLEF